MHNQATKIFLNFFLKGQGSPALYPIPVLVKHFCNTLFEKFTTCSVLQMVSSSCCTNAV